MLRMADRIIHAADSYQVGEGAEALHRTFAPLLTPPRALVFKSKVRPKADGVVAWVNDGRWIAACPNCGEAQIVSKDDPRFLCFVCQNLAVDGEWRPVKFPRDVAGIEAELLRRTKFENRVWLPGESVKQLKDEWDALAVVFAKAKS